MHGRMQTRWYGIGISVTDETIDAWIKRKRGMQCTPQNVPQVCRGEKVVYMDRSTAIGHLVTVVNVGPLVPNADGTGEPASITILFEDGHERNTTLQHITPLARSARTLTK